jgi:ABC-2 type transport system permease protein
MKFREIFRFEFAYQVRRPYVWLFFIVLVCLNFLMTRDRAVSDALFEEFFINSPFLIANTTVFGGLIWLMMAAAVAGDAAARDAGSRMHPLIYTTSITRAQYLGGRFLAAFVLNALLLLAVQVGILLGIYLPGVDPELIGPFRPTAFLTAYAFLSLPNAFVATALQFGLAIQSGRAMASYFGSFILFFMGFFVASFLLYKQGLGTLLDPIGIRFIVEDIAHLWTTIEKKERLLNLEGIVLTNRLLWLSIGLFTVAGSYLRFRFAHRLGSPSRWTRIALFFRRLRVHGEYSTNSPGIGIRSSTPISVPVIPRTFGFSMHTRQTLTLAWTSFQTIATSWAGLALLTVIPLLTIPVVVDQMESNGVPLVPTTTRVINELTAPLSAELSRWVIIPALLIFFAGELIWREREARLGEITDAMPGSEWAPFLGKFLGIGLLLVAFTTLQMSAGLFAQAILGYNTFEIALYLKILFGLQLPEYLLFAFLVLTIHVLVNQKYVGHLVATIAYVFITLSSLFGVDHDLFVFGAGPGWSYTEMRGFGPSLAPWLWFKLYWTAWAGLLAVVGRLFWVRGREEALRFRLLMARRRFVGSTPWMAGTAVVLIFALGGFIFYNTNVLNQYLTVSERKERQAEYERRYERYDGLPQPVATRASLQIEIYPERQKAEIRGSYSLINRTEVAIDSIHVAIVPGVTTGTDFDRKATLVMADEDHGHRIYVLDRPLQRGDSLRLDFEVTMKPRGFRESGIDASVTSNGTFFMNTNWFPAIGYQRPRELISATDRREYGLPPRPLIALLNDEEAYTDRGRGMTLDVVVGTQGDQVAVAPGNLRRTWTELGRRYFHYSTQAIGSEWSFFSANYAVHEAWWENSDDPGRAVGIRIYHHPQHTAHLDRTIKSIRASLDYYSKNFGPYKRESLSVVERPGNGTGLHADAGMITHGEGFTFWDPKDDGHDHPYAIMAHEMAHQWTVPYAAVEGAPVMSESVAWYYGMKVVEHSRGPEALQRLFSYMWQPHPYSPIFRGEPLLRGLDPYMSYRKGPFALNTLSEYIGDEHVNGALRNLLETHRPFDAPLATTLDLFRELRAVTPDSLHYLLHDLFEVNTYWKLGTERAAARPTKKGNWQVILDVETRKVVVDRAGVKKEVSMDEWIDIGVFGPDKPGERKEPLYFRKHRIQSGRQTIIVTVPRRPTLAGIDPYHVLDWEERLEDNIMSVTID